MKEKLNKIKYSKIKILSDWVTLLQPKSIQKTHHYDINCSCQNVQTVRLQEGQVKEHTKALE